MAFNVDNVMLAATIVDLFGSIFNGVFQQFNSWQRNKARLRLSKVANILANKIADNQSLVNKIMDWKSTKSSQIMNDIFSTSAFGNAYKMMKDAISNIETASQKAVNKVNEENKALNASLNDINTVMGNMDQTISGMNTAVSINKNEDINQILSSNSNKSDSGINGQQQSNNSYNPTLTGSGSFGK